MRKEITTISSSRKKHEKISEKDNRHCTSVQSTETNTSN